MSVLKTLIALNKIRVLAKPLRSNTFLLLCKQNLYSQESLGINAFKSKQQKLVRTIPQKEEFIKKITLICSEGNDNLVFSTDLKNMMYLCKDDEEIILLRKMLIKYHTQNSSLRFHKFRFGPEIMRLLYALNQPEEAFSLIYDKNLTTMFDNVATYVILLDLLFENKMYNEMLSVITHFREKQFTEKKYPSSITIFFIAACYKLNTPESFEKAISYWEELSRIGYMYPFRFIWLFSLLAVKQKKGYIAIEAVTNIMPSNVSISIQSMALALEKHYQDVINLLTNYLYHDKPKKEHKTFIFLETFDFLEKEFQNSEMEYQKNLEKLKIEATKSGLITPEALDLYLFQEMTYNIKQKVPGS